MSDRVSITLQVEAPDDTALEKWAITFLEERGFSVARPNENWETVKVFCERLHIHWQTLDRNMAAPGCPNAIVRRGPNGRLLEILSNQDFDAFITRNKRRFRSDRRNQRALTKGQVS